ncbi:MAG: hypothetical protein K8R92_01110 [Planctomycetes bacterium]|nr:hypothetical protein [Planctomycetota bacterium]
MKFVRTLLVLVPVLLLAHLAFAEKDVAALLTDTQNNQPAVPTNNGSFHDMTSSFERFFHTWFIVKLFASLLLSVLLAMLIAQHPRRSTRLNPLSDHEERKSLVVLAVVGAVVAELVQVNSAMALVIFGIGGLIRFRTVLDNPKITGKAILCVLLGLSCGLGQWATAVFVTVFAWLLILWLEMHLSARVKIRVGEKGNLQDTYKAAVDALKMMHCRVKSSSIMIEKRQVIALVFIPSGTDPKELETLLEAKLPRSSSATSVEIEVE